MLPPNLARALAKGTVMSCFVFVFLFSWIIQESFILYHRGLFSISYFQLNMQTVAINFANTHAHCIVKITHAD